MSEDPFLRITNTQGTFNQIPVFEIEVSGGTLQKVSPTKVRLGITGGGGSNVVYAPTGGEYLVYQANASLTAERVVAASDNITIVNSGTSFLLSALTSNISGKQDSITFPLIVASGGTGTVATGSATSLVGVNTSGVVYDYYTLSASTNISITRTENTYAFSTTAGGGARVYRSNSQSIPNSVFTAINFGVERYDTDGFFNAAVNSTRLIAPTSGIYLVTGHVRWAAALAASVVDIAIRKNSATYVALHRDDPTASSVNDFYSIATVTALSSGEFIEMYVSHNDSVARNIEQVDEYSPELSITLLRAL